jgi:hypothetical protein
MFSQTTGGILNTNNFPGSTWVNRTIPASDLYSDWVRADSKIGFMSFHYHLANSDYVGVIRIQAHNDPRVSYLEPVNVEISDGSTGVTVSPGVNADGFVIVNKNKAAWFRLFLDRTSGSSTGNTITAVVHQ